MYKNMFALAALTATLAFGLARAADAPKPADKIIPYPLKTCVVSGEKLGGAMGAPYVLTNGNREIKLCCKSCLTNFNKDTAKYIKKLEDAEKKAK